MKHRPSQPGPEQNRPKYPTPQTNTVPVVKVSSRFWWYLYNDPRSYLLLISAAIATVYCIFRVVDAAVLYNRISSLLANSVTDTTGAWPTFLMEIPKVHYITMLLGMLVNWAAWALRRQWAVLLAAALYLICAIAYIRWAIFLLPEIVLCAIAYMALVRKHNAWI